MEYKQIYPVFFANVTGNLSRGATCRHGYMILS
jgi:hypothetical protein